MKSGTIITIVIILLLAGAGYWTTAQAQKRELLEEFNTKVLEYNTLVKEQDQLITSINELAISLNEEKDIELILQKAKNYLDWVKQHEDTMADFMTYVETNHEGLRKIGLNPDYQRDNIKTTLMTIKENEATAQTTITDTEALQQLLKEFNIKVEESNKLVEEQDRLVTSFNTETNLELRIQKAKAYLNWVDQHTSTIEDFKFYVEINHEALREMGLNPDYMRDDIKSTLTSMQENVAIVQAEITGTEILQQLIAESGTG